MGGRNWNGAALAALLCTGIGLSGAAADTPKWAPWIEGGGFLSSERSRGEVNAFAPLYQNGTGLLFADVKGKLFTESVKEGNFALGYRRMTEWDWNLGVWAGYDVRRSEYHNTFNQVSFGIEALSADYDFRLNGYVPLSDAKGANGLARVEINGPQIFMTGGQEVPLGGVDGEVGLRVPLENWLYDARHHELRLYAGGFYFDDKMIDKAVTGPRLRAEWRVLDFMGAVPGARLTFETEYQHDDYRDHQLEAGLRLRIPLSGSGGRAASRPLSPLERRMTEALERDTDIVTGPRKREAVVDARSGVLLEKVATVSANDDLTSVSDDAGRGTLIVLNGAQGEISGTNYITASGQTIAGGGSQLAVRGITSGQTAMLAVPGAPARLMTDGCFCGDILTLDGGSDLHISGFTLDGDMGLGGAGILIGMGQRNIHLTNIHAVDLSGPAVAMIESNEVTIDGLSVLRNDFMGIFALNDNEITVRNSSFRDITGSGIELDTGNTLVLENVEIDNIVFGNGISALLNNTITGSNVSVSRTLGNGLAIAGGNRVSLSGLTIRDTGAAAVYMENDNDMTIANAVFEGTIGGDLFFFDGPDNSFTGSTGNRKDDAVIGGDLCNVAGGGFTGTLSFEDGTVLEDGVAPCL